MRKPSFKIGTLLLFAGMAFTFTIPLLQGIKNSILLSFLNILMNLCSIIMILSGCFFIIYNASISLKQFLKSNRNYNIKPIKPKKHIDNPHTELGDKEKNYIFLFGSVYGASSKAGNIKVIDNTPYIIKENDNIEPTEWTSVIEMAKKESLSTYTWIKNINADNWKDYAFTLQPSNQPPDNNSIMVYIFKDRNHDVTEAAMNQLVIDKRTKKPCIKHFVANGHSGHDPWLVSVTNECTFEDIRALASVLNINSLLNIDENNWMDKTEVFLANNEYRIPVKSNIFNFIDKLKASNVNINKIECISVFEQDKDLNRAYSLPEFLDEFKHNWRMFTFLLLCTYQDDSFTVKVTGWDRVAIAEYPGNIIKILYPDQKTKEKDVSFSTIYFP